MYVNKNFIQYVFPYGKEKSRAPFPLTVADLGITYLLCYETDVEEIITAADCQCSFPRHLTSCAITGVQEATKAFPVL